ncbi:MAG: hypothetical protein JWM34_2526 [Ilumatobacteraceae bacterium]|nr:hypothetical protein [Ilumatobacteraceae bacterium]
MSPRCALITPISLHEPGNGLAHRARFWHEVLVAIGATTVIHVPLAGAPHAGDEVVAPTVTTIDPALPIRARPGAELAGRNFARTAPDFDVVVAVRSDCAPFAFGLTAGTDATVVVDLDDDDASFCRAAGDVPEAVRYEALVGDIHRRADLVASATGFARTLRVPNSVDVPDHATATSDAGVRRNRAVMVGNFGYAPNVEGARWLIDEVVPRLPDVELVLVGPGSEALAPFGVGYVDDLDAAYGSAAVALVPVHRGSGTRLKALDAFARRVPVVGTTIGLDGLGARPGIDCLVADDAIAFADAIESILGDPAIGDSIAARAFADIVPAHRRTVVREQAEAAVRDAIEHRRSSVLVRAAHLEITETDDGLVVLDRASMIAHHLNPLAASVFVSIDGTATPESISGELREVYGTDEPPTAEVRTTITDLLRSGLVIVRRHAAQGD